MILPGSRRRTPAGAAVQYAEERDRPIFPELLTTDRRVTAEQLTFEVALAQLLYAGAEHPT